MKLREATAALVLGLLTSPAWAQFEEAQPSWQLKRALYMLGSVDESSELSFRSPSLQVADATPAGNFAAGLDFEREGASDRERGSLFGLLRSPLNGDQSFFGAGRVEASRRFGGGCRLTVTDGFKLQTRPRLDASDYWGNAATLSAEWIGASGRGMSVQAGDRRRTLPDLELLGFSRQSAGVGVFGPVGQHGRAEVSADAQNYAAATAAGQRLVLSAEIGTFNRAGIATLRAAWFEPLSDHRLIDTDLKGPLGTAEVGDIGRAEFFEILALQGNYGAVLGDAFFLDPLQSDSDEWDFGRRKQVVTGFATRRLGERATAAAFLRLQRKRGPNLLAAAGDADAASFEDDRVELRALLRYAVGPRFAVLLQGTYVRNWSELPSLDFFRTLGAIGIQVGF